MSPYLNSIELLEKTEMCILAKTFLLPSIPTNLGQLNPFARKSGPNYLLTDAEVSLEAT